MNQQQANHTLMKSLELSRLVFVMSHDDKMRTADIIREADISRLLHGSTIQRELKQRARENHKGKIKRFLSALAKNPYASSGVDILFERWNQKIEVSNLQTESNP
jgi:hypothetical protein